MVVDRAASRNKKDSISTLGTGTQCFGTHAPVPTPKESLVLANTFLLMIQKKGKSKILGKLEM